MFVPKGCVSLTAAVDRLAESRRLERRAAQEELRAELHGGSMLAMVISPSSGDTFVILQQHWALEKAQTWLEQGECLLDADSFYPHKPELVGVRPWPRMERGECATIFVGEQDLQGRMAQQAPDRGGRPEEYNWTAMKEVAREMVQTRGFPGRGNKYFPTKAEFAEAISNEFATRYDHHPSTSSVRRQVNNWLKEFAQN